VSTNGHKVELHKQIILSANHPFIHIKYSILYYGSLSFSLTACTGHLFLYSFILCGSSLACLHFFLVVYNLM